MSTTARYNTPTRSARLRQEKRKRRTRVAATGAGAVIAFVLLLAFAVTFPAFLLMLLLGAAHAEVSPQVPALSFVGSLVIMALIAVIKGVLSR